MGRTERNLHFVIASERTQTVIVAFVLAVPWTGASYFQAR